MMSGHGTTCARGKLGNIDGPNGADRRESFTACAILYTSIENESGISAAQGASAFGHVYMNANALTLAHVDSLSGSPSVLTAAVEKEKKKE